MPSTNQHKIVIKRAKGGKFRVSYFGKNGKMLSGSETINSKASSKKNIVAMQRLMQALAKGEIQITDLTLHNLVKPKTVKR